MCPLGLKVDTGGELAVFHDSRKCAGAATVSVVHPNFKAKNACSPRNTCAGSYEKNSIRSVRQRPDQIRLLAGMAWRSRRRWPTRCASCSTSSRLRTPQAGLAARSSRANEGKPGRVLTGARRNLRRCPLRRQKLQQRLQNGLLVLLGSGAEVACGQTYATSMTNCSRGRRTFFRFTSQSWSSSR